MMRIFGFLIGEFMKAQTHAIRTALQRYSLSPTAHVRLLQTLKRYAAQTADDDRSIIPLGSFGASPKVPMNPTAMHDDSTFILLILAFLTCLNYLGLLYWKTSRDVSRRVRWVVEVALGLIGLCLVWLVQASLAFYPFLEPVILLIAVCSELKVVGGVVERWARV